MAATGYVGYGSTLAGYCGVIDAGRNGVKATLIEGGDFADGGMWPGGLLQTDRERTFINAPNGVSLRTGLIAEIEYRCGQKAGFSSTSKGTLFVNQNVIKTVLQEMLQEVNNNVTLVSGKELQTIDQDGVTGVLNSITCGGTVYPGLNFTDHSYEGDLIARACRTRMGRESAAVTGNRTSGVGPTYNPVAGVKAYYPNGERKPYVSARTGKAVGAADFSLMAFNERIVVTNHSTRINWADLVVPNFNPRDYDLELEIAVAKNLTEIPGSIGESPMNPYDSGDPNAVPQYDMNNGNLLTIGSNWIDQWLDWPSMTWAQRIALRTKYIYYKAGLFKAICSDSQWASQRPALVASTKLWGLVPGVFTNMPVPGMSPIIYIREMRRLVGQAEQTFASSVGVERMVKEPVFAYSYSTMDAHWAKRQPSPEGILTYEGGSGLSDGQQLIVQFMNWGSMKAPYTDCRNLTASWCVSGTRGGWLTYRIEMSGARGGQVTGVAAVEAEKRGMYTGDLNYTNHLRPALVNRGMILTIP